jgi:hypothetical protein
MPRQQFRSEVLSMPGGARVAAATRMSGRKNAGKPQKNATGWQKTAWLWYDTIGEYRFACSWVGNTLSRAGLTVHENGKPTTNEAAIAAMDSLFGGVEGQVEMLRQLGIQMTVTGDSYLVGEDGGDSPTDKWYVVAASEITNSGGVWKVGKHEVDNPLVIRLWKPHPKNLGDSDSPSRAVLPILAEIDGLTKHVAAQIDSRLAGAGLLLLPNEIAFGSVGVEHSDPLVPGTPQTVVSSSLDTFLQELMDTMMTAIANREDASALVPIILQASGEHLDKVRHLMFSNALDEQAIALRTEAIRRLALGMDMPPEILTGTGEMNHWNAWQMEEASIKAHTEPLLQIITSSLTTGYLRPYLEDEMDEEEARNFEIVADTTKLRLRPNRSKEAIELYDRGELSPIAMLRENGFEDADKMTPKEREAFFTQKVAGGSTTPELVAQALRLIGVPVMAEVPQIIESQEARPTRTLDDHPKQDIPDQKESERQAEIAAAEIVVFRALERAGNRIKSKYRDRIAMGAEQSIPPESLYRYTARLTSAEIDDLLDSAWKCLDVLPPLGISSTTLDVYTRALLRENRPHDRKVFSNYIVAQSMLDQASE